MAISSELFYALLVMDSYNRGYNAGINIVGTQIGNATVGTAKGDQEAQAASFFAQAYELANGSTATRMTDVLPTRAYRAGPGGP